MPSAQKKFQQQELLALELNLAVESDIIKRVKAVFGIDFEFYPRALGLFGRLRFANPEAHLVHVLESLLPGVGAGVGAEISALQDVVSIREAEARAQLAQAAEQLGGIPATTALRKGDAAKELIGYADEVGADLIGVGSAQKGAWSSLFFGSVTKALSSEANQSLLAAKRPREGDGPLKVIFATDHSSYNHACVEKLVQFRPEGIERVAVLCASEVDESVGQYMIRDLPEVYDTVMSAIEREIQEKNEAVCEQFRSIGIKAEPIFKRSHPTHAINVAYTEMDADLLILGAKGHGMWDRARLGSVSHHELVATPHNLLVVRA